MKNTEGIPCSGPMRPTPAWPALAFICSLMLSFQGRVSAQQSEKEAELLFVAMGDKLRNARSLTLECVAQVRTSDLECDVKATLALREGDRMSLDVRTKGTRQKAPYTYAIQIISNGAQLAKRENAGEWKRFPTPHGWNREFIQNIVRGGFPTGLTLERIKGDKGEPKDEELAIRFRPIAAPIKFAFQEKKIVIEGRDVASIEYQVVDKTPFFERIAGVAWIDHVTTLPLRRVLVVQGDRLLNISEIYEKIQLDGDIPDSAFALPQ